MILPEDKKGVEQILDTINYLAKFIPRQMEYAQIEKELLEVVFTFENFNQHTYARCVEVETDHKPLVSIMMKSLTSAPPQLQRILLRLQYEITMKYKLG